MTPKTITDKWRKPVPVRGHSDNVWYYRDRRGIDIVAYPPTTGPAHFRISAGQLREYLKELDSVTVQLKKGKRP